MGVAPIALDKKKAGAYLTAKESVQNGHRVYSLELQKIETLGSNLEALLLKKISDQRSPHSERSISDGAENGTGVTTQNQKNGTDEFFTGVICQTLNAE